MRHGSGWMFMRFWNSVWPCQVPELASRDAAVAGDADGVDVAAVDDVGQRVDHEVVPGLWGDHDAAAVDGRQMTALQQLDHRSVRAAVGDAGEVRDQIVDGPAMIDQNADTLDLHCRGVADKGDVVLPEHGLYVLRQCRLWLGLPDGVVITRRHDDLHVLRHHPQILGCLTVLVVHVRNVSLFFLAGIDADAVDHVPAMTR